MELPPQERPPAYPSSLYHDPESLRLPSVPRHELPAASGSASSVSLPELRSLGLPDALQARAYQDAQSTDTPWMPSASLRNGPLPPASLLASQPDLDMTSPRAESVVSADDRSMRAPSVVSMDDPDVRMAAEALSGLGNPDFIRSPSNRSATLPASPGASASRSVDEISQEPEPLLSLLTSSHPWLGGTINGSLNAYTSTKHYSPRFIQYGAEFVERNIGSPVANTVGSMGRRTGVEGSLRRYLGDRGPSDSGRAESEERESGHGNKRRRVMSSTSDEMDVEKGLRTPSSRGFRSRAESQGSFAETLPAYDENSSPKYEEMNSLVVSEPTCEPSRPGQLRRDHSWSTQLMITTSGLGAALSEGSLRSLKFCLGLLRNGIAHVTNLMRALRMLLDEYEQMTNSDEQEEEDKVDIAQPAEDKPIEGLPRDKEEAARTIAGRIKAISDDILKTMKTVVNSVSRYTGGALPENAGVIVRSQLLSIPSRWRAASASTATASAGASEPVRAAHRMLAFAKEGLDMMTQVTLVVDGTVISAEKWLDSLGRRKKASTGAGAGSFDAKSEKWEDAQDPSGQNGGSMKEKQ
ncbi:transcription factor Opi1-domain-containing protein [Lineolata rhizophorae]|uniref:Transcription factor Opi1-domain-containing protein n=1 Tax=Lineolata rhizophorae TaxID=578093 RepID=A0A6A6NYG3_9PEZI|nr:transcription factor Opi1-domain-containing protein [Lineolata rhizophorae]